MKSRDAPSKQAANPPGKTDERLLQSETRAEDLWTGRHKRDKDKDESVKGSLISVLLC
jgi:hypothetical protein